MAQRTYTIYLKGGAALTIRAARFEVTDKGVYFYDDEGEPLDDTYIDPTAILAVIPPSPAPGRGNTGFAPS